MAKNEKSENFYLNNEMGSHENKSLQIDGADHSIICSPTFEKVPFDQFMHDVQSFNPYDNYSIEKIKEIYDNIQIPRRSTSGSAGYDFIAPIDINISAESYIDIPTGIRCKMPIHQFLMIVPRSGLGFKHHISLANTVGIIDSDYYNADNYGHIIVRLIYSPLPDHKSLFYINDNSKSPWHNVPNYRSFITIPKGKGYVQGIFMNYFTTTNENDNENNFSVRTGGFGSTDKT